MKVFLDTDGEMTFENKERLNFIMHYLKHGADPSLVEVKNDRFVREDAEIAFNEIWLPCAIMKQKEIDALEKELEIRKQGVSVMNWHRDQIIEMCDSALKCSESIELNVVLEDIKDILK